MQYEWFVGSNGFEFINGTFMLNYQTDSIST